MHLEAVFPKETSALIMLLGPQADGKGNGDEDEATRAVHGSLTKRGYRYGQRVDNADRDEEAIVSEAYRPGYIMLKGSVPCPGTYTLVMSTYAAGQAMAGPFRLTVACSHKDFKVLEVRSPT